MDNTIRLWDAATGRQVLALKGHSVNTFSRSSGIAFSPDGRRILSAVERRRIATGPAVELEVRLWDATPLQVPAPQQLSSAFSTIAKQLEPSVVNINTESTIKAPKRRRNGGEGMSFCEPSQIIDVLDLLAGPAQIHQHAEEPDARQ